MNDPETPRNPVEELAEEFLERYRRGEHPSITEYTRKHPELSTDILDLFPALVLMEEVGPREPAALGRLVGAVTADGHVLEKIGDYRILRELGRGGMGVVYQAEHVDLGRQVALKVLPYQAAQDKDNLKRFWREARAVARLHHNNIVPVFEVGECQGLHYFAMQLIQGRALDEVLRELRRQRAEPPSLKEEPPGASPATITVPAVPIDTLSHTGSDLRWRGDALHYRTAARLGLQVAEALAHAHGHQILHRDVKPANVMLDRDGVVWLTDFGLAKAEGDTLTRTGDIVGTLRYMAPERFNGQADARSDIYSLGLTLYEYLTLQPAFEESDRGRLIQRVAREEPPAPRKLDRHIPRDLETIVLKASAKEPARRYATAAVMAEDLRRFLADRPIWARRPSLTEQAWRWGRRNPMLAGMIASIAALLVLVAVISTVAAIRSDHEQNATLTQLHLTQDAERNGKRQLYRALLAQAQASRASGLPGQQFDTLETLHQAAALAPELDLPANARLERRNAFIGALTVPDVRAAKQLTGNVHPKGGVAFDARLERYACSDELGNISVRRVADDREQGRLPGPGYGAQRLQFSADGRFLAAKYFQGYKDQPQEYRVWEWRRGRQVLYQKSDVLGEAQDFSPDSRQLVLGGQSDGILTFYELPSGKPIRQQKLGYVPAAVAFDPAGKRLAISGAKTLEIRALSARWRSVARFSDSFGFGPIAWRDDGRLLAAGDGHYRIQVWDLEKHYRQALLVGHQWVVSEVAFNHAGDMLASSSWDGTACLWNPMTGRQLLSTRLARDLRFSPDDTQLAHLRSSRPAFWQVAPSSACRRLYWHEAEGYSAVCCMDFSPDGRLLASGSLSGLRLWDPRTGRLLGRLPIGLVFSVLFQADGGSLLTSGAAGLLRWPVQWLRGGGGGESIRFGPPQFVRTGNFDHVAWDRRGQRVALAENSTRAFLLDLDRPAVTARICEHTGLASCEMSADGKWLATGNFKGSDVRIWDAATGHLVRKLAFSSHAGAIFSPDSRTLLTAAGNEYRFWTVGSWEPGPVIPIENMEGGGLTAFTPDGRMLAVINAFATVKVFDARAQQELATLHVPGSQNLSSLCWSPDSSQLAAATASQAIQLWDLRGIRRRLAAEGLDWEPTLPPEPKALAAVQVQVDLGDATSRLRLAEVEDPAFAVRFNSVVLAFSPLNGRAYLRRAVALRAQRYAARARADALLALQVLPPGNGAWLEPQHAMLFNELAWWSIGGQPPRRDAAAAVLLAQRAVAIAPEEWIYLNTLGVAYYRLSCYPAAVRALERSLREGKDRSDAFDLFFLAMCHQQLGQPARARACYDQAVRWVQAHRLNLPADWARELLLYRAEAAAVLHIPNGALHPDGAAP